MTHVNLAKEAHQLAVQTATGANVGQAVKKRADISPSEEPTGLINTFEASGIEARQGSDGT